MKKMGVTGQKRGDLMSSLIHPWSVNFDNPCKLPYSALKGQSSQFDIRNHTVRIPMIRDLIYEICDICFD